MDSSDFKKEINGKKSDLYTLKNNNGIEISITNFGLKIVSIKTPDRDGKFDDIVLGFKTIDDYLNTKEVYYGAVIGRYANRIANGRFSINGKVYQLEQNNDSNHLHGGTNGFHNVVWDTGVISKNKLSFSRISPHMEEGFPGELFTQITYSLTETNELRIAYKATTDRATVINLTHHSYFNLSGEGNGKINDHILQLNADQFTPVNSNLIPTGELVSVTATPFDFRNGKPVGEDLNSRNAQLEFGCGYDHNFVLNKSSKNAKDITFAARVTDPKSGRTLEVFTAEPGIQFYGGNWLDGKTIGKCGKPYLHQGAFCLETQHFPDSPNQPGFPSTLLKPGGTYNSLCIYKFGTVG